LVEYEVFSDNDHTILHVTDHHTICFIE